MWAHSTLIECVCVRLVGMCVPCLNDLVISAVMLSMCLCVGTVNVCAYIHTILIKYIYLI